jgi:hypothetical protein
MRGQLSAELVAELGGGPAYSFADWPNAKVPTFGAGVYTIWDNEGRFIYVGMSGRKITAKTARPNKPKGLYTRLASHSAGRRSGDQFCVYVADRFVLPKLLQEDIAAIVSGRHQMDAFVRLHIHGNLSYRFIILPNGAAARAAEAAMKRGEWKYGKPCLIQAPKLARKSKRSAQESKTRHTFDLICSRARGVGLERVKNVVDGGVDEPERQYRISARPSRMQCHAQSIRCHRSGSVCAMGNDRNAETHCNGVWLLARGSYRGERHDLYLARPLDRVCVGTD